MSRAVGDLLIAGFAMIAFGFFLDALGDWWESRRQQPRRETARPIGPYTMSETAIPRGEGIECFGGPLDGERHRAYELPWYGSSAGRYDLHFGFSSTRWVWHEDARRQA